MKIVTCNRSDDLECLLNTLRGEKCYHWHKHIYDSTCTNQNCMRDGCNTNVKCIEVKDGTEENSEM